MNVLKIHFMPSAWKVQYISTEKSTYFCTVCYISIPNACIKCIPNVFVLNQVELQLHSYFIKLKKMGCIQL